MKNNYLIIGFLSFFVFSLFSCENEDKKISNLVDELDRYYNVIHEQNYDSVFYFLDESQIQFAKKQFPSISDKDLKEALNVEFKELFSELLTIENFTFTHEIARIEHGITKGNLEFYFLSVSIINEEFSDKSLMTDLLIGVSKDRGKTWNFVFSDDHSKEVLQSYYDKKIIEELFLVKKELFSFSEELIVENLKNDLADFYSSLITCDSIKIVSYLTDVFLNAGNYNNPNEIKEIIQEMINNYRQLAELVSNGSLTAEHNPGEILVQAVDGNILFYSIVGNLTISNEEMSRTATEILLGISEDSGESWKFINYDIANRELAIRLLETRYTNWQINQLMNN